MYIDPVYFCFCSNIIYMESFFYYFFIIFLLKTEKGNTIFSCVRLLFTCGIVTYTIVYIYIFFLFYDRCISFSYTSVICFFISFVHSRIYSSTLSTDCCCCCCIFAIIPITLLLLLLPGCAIICCAV